MFDQISKHLEFRQKDSATRRIFYSLLSVWKCGQTQSSMLDILQKTLLTGTILPCETWQTAAFKTFRCIFADTVLWARVFPTCINFWGTRTGYLHYVLLYLIDKLTRWVFVSPKHKTFPTEAIRLRDCSDDSRSTQGRWLFWDGNCPRYVAYQHRICCLYSLADSGIWSFQLCFHIQTTRHMGIVHTHPSLKKTKL